MFPMDPISTRQLLDAELLVAAQRSRTRVESHRTPLWRVAFEKIAARPRHGALPAEHELFTGLSRRELREAATYFSILELPAGRTLGEQGARVNRFVTILEGRVGVTIDGIPHAVLDDGSQFSAIPLLDDDRPTYRASFNVMVPSRVAVVEAEQFPAMLQRFPTVAERIHAIADVRRAYFAGLAAASNGETVRSRRTAVEEYPVHLTNGMLTNHPGSD